MAGRQFSFFLGHDDQVPFERALRESGDIAFFREDGPSSRAIEVETSAIKIPGTEPFKILISRRIDLADVRFIESRGPYGYYADQDRSPFVEFSRFPNVVDDRYIRASRLYRIDKYWGGEGKLVSKPEAFIEWGERLYKLAKKSLTKVERGYFAGEEALALRQTGIAFEGLDIAMGGITPGS